MAKNVKLADIANQVGVSVVTVSKALSGQKGVSDKLREKIIALADDLGYQHPSKGKNESGSRKQNVGILIHEKHFGKYNSFYLQMYQMLVTQLVGQGDYGILEVISREMEQDGILPNILKEGNLDAIVLLGEFSKSYCEFLKSENKIAVYCLDFSDEKKEVNSVISDSFYGAYYLTNYLFEQGHKDIAFVGSIFATSSIMDRYLGYTKSIMEHGQNIRPDWRIEDRDFETGYIFEPEKLMLPLERPTAFVCNCDLTAGVLIKHLEQEGYSVPEDYSVVGYDNFIFPGTCDVEITTYEVDMLQMVKTLVEIMNRQSKENDSEGKTHIVTGHLVVKNSVKKLLA